MSEEQRTKPYTTTELATAAGVSDAYVRRLLLDGKLTGQKFGPWWLIPADVGRAWLASRAVNVGRSSSQQNRKRL